MENSVKIIDFNTIKALSIPETDCLRWASEVILEKANAILPEKISITTGEAQFFNTMPSWFPKNNIFGLKVVSRYPQREPALCADILLYNSQKGSLQAIMDGTWITTMRTGAVAALSINLLQVKNYSYSFIGLGNTARATLLMLNTVLKNAPITVKILKYKDQHEQFKSRFVNFDNIVFEFYNSINELIRDSCVLISCVTVAEKEFADVSHYPEGILVVPIHTKGFQNCDLFFDKIYCDDINHIRGFKNFSRYKNYDEVTSILSGKNGGRTSDKERIIVYNIGISLQDIFFAQKIYDMINNKCESKLVLSKIPKVWV
jgi:ornithine cyclodeaminase/alanine dehydrogenase-like protein (mu-crystallin family)